MSDKGKSRFSRFKKRVSSMFSPSPPASRQKFALPDDNMGRLETPSLNADTHLAPPSLSHCPSISSVSAHSTANTMPAHPSPSPQRPVHQVEDSAPQSYSSTHLATTATPQIPQASAFQGPSHTFGGAHNFVMNNPMFNDYNANADNFMKELLQETIIGAEFDSSARDPPPRCHPGTRLAIIQRCLDFIMQCQGEGKLRWVVGQAGVGKSAVMQMVTEKAPDGVIFASIFLSINGRRDGTKVVLTIVYQLAVKCPSYRQFVRSQITLDPSLLRKSLSVQFRKFIVEPFMLERLFEPSRRVLMVIDGLDECDNILVQQNLLELITDFCITYPASPMAWIVASRPEPHITSFFDQAKVKPAHIREEIDIDSDEACEEVQRYLRDELKKIQLEYPTLRRKRIWPLEHEFTKIASSAGGLFAYAATVAILTTETLLQSIAEDTPFEVTLGASVFFAINGRNDGTKTITTIVYQLAIKSEPYRRFIEHEITHDPALLTKSITAQFERLIVQPFIHPHLLDPAHRYLILIDGLDECNSHDIQQELLLLIADFCMKYPNSPLIWIVASRPEYHITCIFDEDNVKSIYEKEEILVDTKEAREDAERFLRDQLDNIKRRAKSLKHLKRWPLEYDFLQIAKASGGLMVYASTVVKYIRDPRYGNPGSRLRDVLKLIDANLDSVKRNPMAQLDALYLRIMCSLPDGIVGSIRKLLLMLAGGFDGCFAFECNLLAITSDDAYGATHHLPSVVDAPNPNEAHNFNLRSFHKSFVDYLSDYMRSEFSPDIKREYQELVAEYTFRILGEAPEGIDFDGDYDLAEVGTLTRGPGNISLSWPVGNPQDDNRTRRSMYTKAALNVIRGFKNGEIPFRDKRSIEALTSRFKTYGANFPYADLNDVVFGDQHPECVEHGILKQAPLHEICVSNMKYHLLKLQFRCPAAVAKMSFDTWNPYCEHGQDDEWEEDRDSGWTVRFSEHVEETSKICTYCCRQFERRLEEWRTHFPEHPVTFLPSSTKTSWVEIRFVDPEDGASEWTYWFLLFTGA